jgi:hypothetical protein
LLANLFWEKSVAFELFPWKTAEPALMVKFWREAAVLEALATRYRFHFYSIVSLGSVLDEVIVFAVGS